MGKTLDEINAIIQGLHEIESRLDSFKAKSKPIKDIFTELGKSATGLQRTADLVKELANNLDLLISGENSTDPAVIKALAGIKDDIPRLKEVKVLVDDFRRSLQELNEEEKFTLFKEGALGEIPEAVLPHGGGGGKEPEKIRTWGGMEEFLESDYLDGAAAVIKLKSAMEALNFTNEKGAAAIEHITGAMKEKHTQMNRLQLSYEDEEGNLHSSTMMMDKLGRVTVSTSAKFRSLAENIAKNASEFAKWAVGATVLFSVLRQISESTQVLIENQTELATIAVSLGVENEALAGIFDDVAYAANMTSESIDGVLQGYTQAIRAAGGAATESERLSLANILLTDSLILSKLSTLDQSAAMDTLVAALGQSNISLDQGRKLLDTWVATTKIANVDLRTLAESYAIMATTAKNAGIEVGATNNELVGLIATLAEQTQLTPTETGNALRAVVSGLNTKVAIEELRNYGISIETLDDGMVGFMETMEQLSYMVQEGIISPEDLTEIARAIGGGVRRQVNVEVLIKNLARAQEINEQVASSSGDAMDALERQTETVQSSITRLNNSFIEVAQTLGVEGGLLTFVTDLVGLFTTLIHILNNLSETLGDSTLSAFLLGGAALYAKAKDVKLGAAIPNFFDSLGKGGADPGGDRLLGSTRLRSVFPETEEKEALLDSWTPGDKWFAGLGAAIAIGIPARSNIKKEEYGALGGNIVGGGIGAWVGSLTGTPEGVIMGAQIGSSMGESFVNLVSQELELSGEIGTAFVRIADLLDPETESEIEVEAAKIDQERDLLKSVGYLLYEATGRDVSKGGLRDVTGASTFQSDEERAESYALSVIDAMDSKFLGIWDKLPLKDLKRALPDYKDMPKSEEGYTDLEKLIYLLSQISESEFISAQEAEAARAGDITGTPLQQRGKTLIDINADIITKEIKSLLSTAADNLISGELGGKAYNDFTDTVNGMNGALTNILPAIFETENSLVNIGSKSYDAARFIEEYAEVVARLSDEEKDLLLKMSTQAATREYDTGEFQTDISDQMLEVLNTWRVLIMADSYESATIIKSSMESYTDEEAKLFAQYYKINEEALAEVLFEGNKELIGVWKEELPKVTLMLSPGVYMEIADMIGKTQASPEALAQTQEQIDKQFGETGIDNPPFLDVPFAYGSEEYKSIVGGDAYQQLAGQLLIAGYLENISEVILQTSADELVQVDLDSRIIQMLLGGIQDNTEQMVDGIYNLPTDGSFYVPWTGVYATKTGGGYSGIDDTDYTGIGDGVGDDDAEEVTLTDAGVVIDPSKISWIMNYFKELALIDTGTEAEEEPFVDPFDTAANKYLEQFMPNLDRPEDQLPPTSLQLDELPSLEIPIEGLGQALENFYKTTGETPMDFDLFIARMTKLASQRPPKQEGWSTLPKSGFGPDGASFRDWLENLGSQIFDAEPQSQDVNVNVETTTVLQVDGYILAKHVSKYLGNEISRSGPRSSTNSALQI